MPATPGTPSSAGSCTCPAPGPATPPAAALAASPTRSGLRPSPPWPRGCSPVPGRQGPRRMGGRDPAAGRARAPWPAAGDPPGRSGLRPGPATRQMTPATGQDRRRRCGLRPPSSGASQHRMINAGRPHLPPRLPRSPTSQVTIYGWSTSETSPQTAKVRNHRHRHAAADDRPSGRVHSGTRGLSDRAPPSAAPRSDRLSGRLATPKVAGQATCLLMWSGRLALPRPPRTRHKRPEASDQGSLRRFRDCARNRWPLRGSRSYRWAAGEG
jgi:hypothetical protein